jgi:hypothetical protein
MQIQSLASRHFTILHAMQCNAVLGESLTYTTIIGCMGFLETKIRQHTSPSKPSQQHQLVSAPQHAKRTNVITSEQQSIHFAETYT